MPFFALLGALFTSIARAEAPPPAVECGTEHLPCEPAYVPGSLSLVRGGLRTSRFELGEADFKRPVVLGLSLTAEHAIAAAYGTRIYAPSGSNLEPVYASIPLLFAFPVEFASKGSSQAAKTGVAVRNAGRIVIIGETVGFMSVGYTGVTLVAERSSQGRDGGPYQAHTVDLEAMTIGTAAGAWGTTLARSSRHGGVGADALGVILLSIAVGDVAAIWGAHIVDDEALDPKRLAPLLTGVFVGNAVGVFAPLVRL